MSRKELGLDEGGVDNLKAVIQVNLAHCKGCRHFFLVLIITANVFFGVGVWCCGGFFCFLFFI